MFGLGRKKELEDRIKKLEDDFDKMNDKIASINTTIEEKEKLFYKNINGYAMLLKHEYKKFGGVTIYNTLYKNGQKLIEMPINSKVYIQKDTSEILIIKGVNDMMIMDSKVCVLKETSEILVSSGFNNMLRLSYDVNNQPFLQKVVFFRDTVLRGYVSLECDIDG